MARAVRPAPRPSRLPAARRRNHPSASVIDDIETSFRCVLRCGSREDIVVVVDSLLH